MTLIRNPGEILFITFNVHGKKPLFRNPKACSFFLHTLRYYKPQLKFQLLGYVVMEDHIHLLMRPPPRWKYLRHYPEDQRCFRTKVENDESLEGTGVAEEFLQFNSP